MITTAAINIVANETTRSVQFIVVGDEGYAKDVAEFVMKVVRLTQAEENFLGLEECEQH